MIFWGADCFQSMHTPKNHPVSLVSQFLKKPRADSHVVIQKSLYLIYFRFLPNDYIKTRSDSMSRLTDRLSQYWNKIQASLFPWLEEELDPLTEMQQKLITILELVRIEQFLPNTLGFEGRPPKTRSALARAFAAKMVYNIDTTSFLIERLKSDKNLRRICGWESVRELPSESTFSRAFAHFAETELPQRAHEALIKKTLSDEVVLHNSRDSTAIEAREKAEPKPKKESKKRGVPKMVLRKSKRNSPA